MYYIYIIYVIYLYYICMYILYKYCNIYIYLQGVNIPNLSISANVVRKELHIISKLKDFLYNLFVIVDTLVRNVIFSKQV